MEVTQIEETMKESLNIDAQKSSIAMMMQSFMKSVDFNDLTEKQKHQLESLLNDVAVQMMADSIERRLLQRMKDQYAGILKEHYTQAEVDAQIEFYSSPIGQRVMSQQTAINQAYMDKIGNIISSEVSDNILKIVPVMIEGIHNIVESDD